MQIGLDLRFLHDDMYSQFVGELVKHLVEKERGDTFIIYTNIPLPKLQYTHVQVKCVNIKNGGWREQTTFLKILKHDKNDCVIFFNHYKPILYKEFYFIVLPSLKDIYYQEFDSYFHKYKYLYLIEKNLKNAHKTICFDISTQNELIERFNLREDKIELMPGFFIEQESQEAPLYDIKNLDMRIKYQLKNDFLIYSGEDSIEKNLEKLLYVLEKLDKKDLDIVFLGDKISKNIPLRNLIIKHNLQERVKFLGFIKDAEKKMLCQQSLGFVFPSLYETFPFTMGEALLFNVPIIASDLKSISHIFGDTIAYFSPISKNSMLENLRHFLENKTKRIHYKQIKEQCNAKNTIECLLKIIK